MCLGMVFVMTTYNFMLNGMFNVLTPLQMVKEMIMVFIIALALELVIVWPIAHKVVFSLPFKKEKKFYMILTLSTCMVIGMVFFMSIYGLIHASIAGSLTNQHVLISLFTIFAKKHNCRLPNTDSYYRASCSISLFKIYFNKTSSFFIRTSFLVDVICIYLEHSLFKNNRRTPSF